MERGFLIHWLTRVDVDTVVGVVTAGVVVDLVRVMVGVAKETVDVVLVTEGVGVLLALVVLAEGVGVPLAFEGMVVLVAEGVGVPLALEGVAVIGGVVAMLSAYCSRMILAYRAGER